MRALVQSPERASGLSLWAVYNLVAAAAWGIAGLIAFALSFLSVHGEDSLIPLLLLGASGLMAWSCSLLLPMTGGRSPRRAVLPLGLAILAASGYCALIYALDAEAMRSFDPGTAGLVHIPAILALVAVIELVYLLAAYPSERRG
jgi:hypothetical protein